MVRSGKWDSRESLDGLREVVLGVGREGIEGVAEPALADELERGSAHPLEHVDLLWAVGHARFEGSLKLEAIPQLDEPSPEEWEGNLYTLLVME